MELVDGLMKECERHADPPNGAASRHSKSDSKIARPRMLRMSSSSIRPDVPRGKKPR
ncbi:hypothetical protein ACSFBX_20685 [Variovorax sp. RB2P76]|uniref:hypothetical protein n=1 Tax=Variovorax sp. RB2P76 TaxID=3443736 RepID=UPI003F47FF48